jgi:prepilin-type N-terminal cleavage/methylation domain-containing protein
MFISLNREQKGFTLIEVMVTMALMVTLMFISIGAYRYFYAGRSLDAATREITTQIREAQTMSVATGNTYRIYFDVANSDYVLQSRQGSEWDNVGSPRELPGPVKFDSSAPPSFGGDASAEFYARGVSEDGQVVVRGIYGATKTIQLTGETVNVSVS